MNQEQQQLCEALERLHAELEQTQVVDDDLRALLKHLQSDIEAALKEEPCVPAPTPLRSRLDNVLAQIEDSHPQLTRAVQQVLNNLANV